MIFGVLPRVRSPRLLVVGLIVGLVLTAAPALAQLRRPVERRSHENERPRMEEPGRMPGVGHEPGRPEREFWPPELPHESPEFARRVEPVRAKEREGIRWREVVREFGKPLALPLDRLPRFAKDTPPPFRPKIITILPETPEAFHSIFEPRLGVLGLGRSIDDAFAASRARSSSSGGRLGTAIATWEGRSSAAHGSSG